MKIFKTLVATLASALLVSACGGGGGSGTLTSPPPGGSGGGSPSPSATAIAVSTDTAAIQADGTTTAKISAIATDANNVALPGVKVGFKATSGALAVTQATTDANGLAAATLTSGGNATIRTITVTATAGSLTSTVDVAVIGKGSTLPVASLTVVSSTPTIQSDGSSRATISALARDASNNLIPNVPVAFTASSGGIAAINSTTDASGAANATLSTAGDPTLRTITVTATVNSIAATVKVQVVPPSGSVTVQMGSGIGASFTSGTISASSTNLSPGGNTSLQVVFQQSDSSLYTQPVTVSFSSPCAAQNQAAFTPSTVTTSTGVATVNYVASGCSPTDLITATATVGSHQLSATVTLNVAAATIGSIRFVSATPATIALKGIGSTALPESSTVIFKVLDQNGSPRPGAVVNFSLNTSVGGVQLQNSSQISDATGTVQTTVQSGTVSTPVRVTAVVQNLTPTISTQSSQLTISTGIPQQNSFSVAVTCANVEAWTTDGVQVKVTARVSDRFNNPVPDGTAVYFTTEGGQIDKSCTTLTAAGNSNCTVNWTSQNPRAPADASLPFCSSLPAVAGTCDRAGRSTILAIAIGEESFTDTNGNGAFDNGEPFVDMGERYLDSNENGKYDAGEYFYDFNNNSTRDAPDGFFNGVLCKDTSGRCNPSLQSTGIGASNLIIMSGSSPDRMIPTRGSALADLHVGSSGFYTFTFADVNNNPMPAGTTISATVTGTGLSIGAPASFTVPCTTEPTSYSFIVVDAPSSPPTSGFVTLTITTPAGVVTSAAFPIHVIP